MSVSASAGATTGDFVVVIAQHNGNVTIADNNGSTPFTEDINDWQPIPTSGIRSPYFPERFRPVTLVHITSLPVQAVGGP